AIHDDGAELIQVRRGSGDVLELRRRGYAADLRETEELERFQMQPAHVDLMTAHREPRRRRERVMVVVQLLAGDEHRDRPQIGRSVVGFEVPITLRMTEAVDHPG